MAVEFRLPDLGEGITEGELVRWLVKPGDKVALDQAIAEVQTDKAVVEMPAPAAGTILSLGVEEGQVVPVGTVLLTIEDAAQDAVPATPASEARQPATAGTPAAQPAAKAAATGAPTRPAEAAHANGGAAQADGGGMQADGGGAQADGGRWSAASVAPQRRALATPAVRRLARELGVNIATIGGSGPAGRVLAEDVRAAVAAPSREAAPAGAPQAGEAAAAPPAVPDLLPWTEGAAKAPAPRERPRVELPGVVTPPVAEEGPAEERLPLRGLRRRIAENMVLSVSTIPQVTSLVEVDATALVALRRSVLPAAEAHGVRLSYLPFVVKALVHALRLYPYVNATIDDRTKEIVLKRHYHIGIATATPDGLLVPVLRHADRLTILQIASELMRLAEAGRERKLGLDELRGSTFTISNFGAAGGYFATPIINPGEAGILGLGRIAERPWAADGRVEARPVLPLSFTADHRLIDGELALQFLNTLTASLENPNLLLLEMR